MCLQSRVNMPSQSVTPSRDLSPLVLTGVQWGSTVSWRYSHQPGQPKSLLPLQPPYIEEENLGSGEGPWKPRPAGKSFWYLA